MRILSAAGHSRQQGGAICLILLNKVWHVVARAYLDQLNRTKAIRPERARAVRHGLAKVDELRTGKERSAAATLENLDAVAAQLAADAKAAKGRDAIRLQSLSDTLKGRTARLR